MNQEQHENVSLSRRDALKAIAATSGVVALANLPMQWQSPLIEAGALPAFAATSATPTATATATTGPTPIPVTSPNDYPFTNAFEGVSIEGAASEDLQIAAVPGWMVVSPKNGTVGAADYGYPWIVKRPWAKIKRKWDVFFAPSIWGALVIKVKFQFSFGLKTGHGSKDRVADDNEVWCFGMSGMSLDVPQYYVVKSKIKKQKLEIIFPLPALTSGFYPFFLSIYFPMPIMLVGGGAYNPGYFLGPGICGDKISLS